MKSEVLNALLTARTLFDTARSYCFVRDRYVASAGLVVLQDALELVLYSCLLQVGADEKKNIESLSFDQLIGELKSQNLKVIKSGTLKAMNKQRVLIKHHAQLAEPVAVQNYYQASLQAADDLLRQVVGKPLRHIVVADAISDSNLAVHIHEAEEAIESGKYRDAMVSIRKLLYLAVEWEYDIRSWEEYDIPSQPRPLISSSLGKGPWLTTGKAPWHTRNRDWIQRYVTEPTDYIQLDYDRVQIDMMDLGIDPEEFFNVWRLTPSVYRTGVETWAINWDASTHSATNDANARYCLDVVLSILMKKQLRQGIVRVGGSSYWKARMLRDQPLMKRASSTVAEEGRTILRQGEVYYVGNITSALDGEGDFVRVFQGDSPPYVRGYVPADSCEIVEE